MDAEDIKNTLIEVFGDTFLQVGGDETVGKGFVRVKALEVR
jgi:CRISPR/Cas system CMR subunit Cmr4 (Cas7 group RAMP superfamily)